MRLLSDTTINKINAILKEENYYIASIDDSKKYLTIELDIFKNTNPGQVEEQRNSNNVK